MSGDRPTHTRPGDQPRPTDEQAQKGQRSSTAIIAFFVVLVIAGLILAWIALDDTFIG